uniref:Uncharacterized protein n=1 Tax=Anguilla anguilla TaxID=7936 RepID=A0A0E9P7H2_ANGAN
MCFITGPDGPNPTQPSLAWSFIPLQWSSHLEIILMNLSQDLLAWSY